MKKKHPFLYNIIRRSIVVVLLAMMALTAYNQSTGSLISPEGLLAKIITPIQGFVSQASQAISNYMYRVKLRSNIEYEYNQLKAQNDELTLRSILYEELEQENTQLRALLGEYKSRSTMNPVLARVIASETGNYFSTFTINKGKNDGVDTQMAVITSEGLVGYTYEVFDTTSKVITIIDDQASLAALIESSRDQGAVKGTLGSTESTRAIEDSKHYIVVEPAADFEHIENVLVLRYYADVEAMPDNYDNTEVIIAPVATARPQAVIEEERLTNSTPVPLPDAPGKATPTPEPEALDIVIDEEAMGDLAERIAEATSTPAPETTEEPIVYDDPEVDAPFPDDL